MKIIQHIFYFGVNYDNPIDEKDIKRLEPWPDFRTLTKNKIVDTLISKGIFKKDIHSLLVMRRYPTSIVLRWREDRRIKVMTIKFN